MHQTANETPAFTLIDFDQLCQTLYEAAQGVSGDTLLSQCDLDESASYARLSRLKDSVGRTYTLIQIEEYAARTVDDSEENINQAVLALIQASGYRPGKLVESLRYMHIVADSERARTIH